MVKKLILTLFLFCPLYLLGQNVQLLIGQDNRFISEIENTTDELYLYSYVEANKEGNLIQLIAEPKIYKELCVHTEYRTDFAVSSFYVGLFYSLKWNWGFVNIEPMLKYENGLDYQTSLVFGMWYGKFDAFGYVDTWDYKRFRLFSEIRVYYAIYEHIGLGLVLDIAKQEKWSYSPYFAIRYKF